MARFLALLFALLLPGVAYAACPPIPFIFQQGAPFNAPQVNTDFAHLRDCVNAVTGAPGAPGTPGAPGAPGTPGTPGTIWWVANNAELKALAPFGSPIYRAGFTAAGDGGSAIYHHSNTACSLNGGAGDDGSQIRSASAGCWLLDPQGGLVDLRLWGAQANLPSFDSGPAIRASALYSELSGTTISVPAGTFYLNTLDPEGTGALVLGKTDRNVPAAGYPLPTFKTMPNFVGQVWHTAPDMCFVTEPAFILGPGLNRPLVFIKANSVSARLENLCLSGNRPNQSGYAGGPEGKLYAVVLEDATAPQPASSFTAKAVAFRDGYNGNLYQGGYRSLLYLTDVWSLYSGQTTADTQLKLSAYDSIIYNLQQGFSAGYGVVIGGGMNYTLTSGGFFFNGGPGLYVHNGTVDLQVTGMRFNDHKCHALMIDNSPPIPGNRVGGRVYTGLVFNDNSQNGNGLCDDINAVGDTVFRDTFVGTIFDGAIKSAATIYPRHNVGVGSNVRLVMNGTVTASGGSNVSGFTNDYTTIVGDLQVNPGWVPHLWGTVSGGGGTETPDPGWPTGHWTRAGKQATISGSMKISAFAATGDMVVGEFPHEAAAGTYTSCSIARIVGWTPPAGFTMMTMIVPGGSRFATLFKNGVGVTPDEVAPSEFVAPIELTFTCSYPVKDGT